MRGIGIPMMVLFACFVSPVWSQSEIITFDAPCGGTGLDGGPSPEASTQVARSQANAMIRALQFTASYGLPTVQSL